MTTPPEEYRVQLDAYAGPLDLLLYLVKRHEIDLHDIPIAKLTDQYMAHLRLIQAIDVDTAGEFLVMAATLLEIKSQVIVPTGEQEQTDSDSPQEESFDPRLELVQQLLAYKAYKDAAAELERREDAWAKRFPATAKKAKKLANEDSAQQKDLDLEDVNVMDLCEAFSHILSAIGQTNQHEVTYDDTPISLHADDIADRLSREGRMTLGQIFVGRRNQSEMIGLFLATLELVRQRRIRVVQEDISGEISLEPVAERAAEAGNHEDAETDWRDPETGQMQYDWPDEASRLRAQRRAKVRATLAAKREAEARGETVADDAIDEAELAEFGDEQEEAMEEEDLLDDDEGGLEK